MMEAGYVNAEAYKMLCFTIKEEMDEWQEECERYNDGEDFRI